MAADRPADGSAASSLREKAARAPERPGCYLFKARSGRVLYVGKAKLLRRRLRSYFQKPGALAARTEAMLREAHDIEVILSATEVDALILENSLIKKNRPRFNVLLRDDKNFPYLKLTLKDRWPRVVLVRKPRQDGNLYYGPYTPASVARRSLKMVARFFQVATCYEKFDGSRARPCLLYQMNQCLAPCVEKLVDAADYARAVQDVRLFLEGRNRELLRSLADKMQVASEAMEYERAAHFRDLLDAVEALGRRQNVAAVGLRDQDYFGFKRQGGRVALQVFEMRTGLVQSRREFFFEELDVDDGVFLRDVIGRYYSMAAGVPGRVFCSGKPDEDRLLEEWLSRLRSGSVEIRVPRRGVHREMMATVLENAGLAWDGRFGAGHNLGVQVLESLRETLGLDDVPVRIEGFDISHVQGTDTVASVVVWEGGRPRSSEYRRMRIRAAGPGDDYAAMGEAVLRRYRRRVGDGQRLPDLILIDGGKGQLGAACRSLETLGIANVPVLALAKQEEEVFVPGASDPLPVPADAPALHLLTRIRDEAHRFAVTYHRKRRSKRTLTTELTGIPGIGPGRARKLIRAFGSVKGVREASNEALTRAIGPVLGQKVRRHLG